MKDAHARYVAATQQLINIKWWLRELESREQDKYIKSKITKLACDTDIVINNLLKPDGEFVNDKPVSVDVIVW